MRTFITFMIVLMMTVLMMTASAFAGDYWKGLKGKVKGASTKKDTSVTTAVGGVRATRNSDPDSLYWKGKEVPLVVDAAQLVDFNAALDQAMQEDFDGAAEGFRQFIEKYPASPLKPDAMDALKTITTSQAEPVVEEDSPASEIPEAQASSEAEQDSAATDAGVTVESDEPVQSEQPVQDDQMGSESETDMPQEDSAISEMEMEPEPLDKAQ